MKTIFYDENENVIGEVNEKIYLDLNDFVYLNNVLLYINSKGYDLTGNFLAYYTAIS